MLTTTKMKLVAVTVLGVGMIACSSSSSPDTVQTHHDGGTAGADGGTTGVDTGGGGGGTMTLAGFCSSLLTTIATIESKCEGGSVADWEAELNGSNANTCAALASAEAAGRVTFDGSQASACLATYSSVTCDYLTDSDGTEPASCIATLSGTVAKGGTCYSDDDCAGTASECLLASTGTTQSCTGTCTPYLAAGATCGAMNSACAPGYQCTAAAGSTKETCTAIPSTKPAALGATCGYDQTTMAEITCAAGLVCDPTSSKCVALIAMGDSCAADSYACEPFTYCDGTTKKCVAGAASGAPCGLVSGTEVQCAAGLQCKDGDNMTSGTCGTLGGSGAACTGAADCQSNTCGTDKKCTAPCTEI